MAIVIIFLIIIFIIALAFWIFDEYNRYIWHAVTMVISAGTIVMFLIIWPIVYTDYKSEMAVYMAVSSTIQEARNGNNSDIERAAMITSIIEVNQKLASAKYYNTGMFKDTVPNAYAELEYLK